jgi:subtilase family serine protease
LDGFPESMKKLAPRTIVLLLACLLGVSAFGFLQSKASADTGPDLIVQDIALSPVNPAIDDTVTITVTVKNQGTALAGASYVTCYVDNEILATKPVSSLDAGVMGTAAFTWQATQGTHTIRAVADSSGIINETDETNNANTYTLTTLAPDLAIQSITWSPSNPSGGDSTVISIVVKNDGNIQSHSTNLELFIDGNTRGTQDVAAINPGASLTKTYTWTALTGQHTFRAVVDEAGNNSESDETNNELTVIFSTGSLDLAFQAVAWAPQNPSKFDTVTCNVTVINYGQGRADSWYLAYFLDGTLESTISGEPLEAGASANITFSWETLQDKHDIRIILDYYDQLSETDEDNNEYTITITTLLPDLIVSDISWLPENPGAGDEMTYTVIIKNQGSGRAAASRAASYIDGRFISYLDTAELNADAETTITFTWQATSGTHSVRIFLDYDHTLSESNRDNNDTRVNVTVAPPDLIVQNISWSPEDVTLDETVTFIIEIKNQGGGRALDFHVAYFLDDALLATEFISSLNAGASVNGTCEWQVLNGRHTFKAIVNYNNYITESDTTNNEKSTIFAPKLPDLAITSITWSPPDIPAGQSVIFTIGIENQGSISAAPSRMACYVDGAVAGYVDIIRLEPGATTTAYFTWAAAEGSHVLTVILDSTNQIEEIEEANNTRIINIPLLDLIIEDITFTSGDIQAGETLEITVLVKNQGASATEDFIVSLYVDGVKISSQEQASIAGGESVPQVFSWVAESGLHTFKIILDIDGTVIESNETNNEMEIEYATATPDLIVEDMSWTMSDDINSNEATFTITIKNIGTGTAAASQVQYYFDGYPAEYKDIDSIAAGETASFSFIAILSTGQHTANIFADYEELIEELDEENNESIITFSTIAPDLCVRTISYSPLDAVIGDVITISVKLENRGKSEALNIRLSLSIDGVVADYTDLPELGIASSITCEFQWTVTEGEHEILAFIDADQAISESNEQNNIKSRTVSFAQAGTPTNSNSPGASSAAPAEEGIIDKYWWMLLLLAGLLVVAAFVSTFRYLKRR